MTLETLADEVDWDETPPGPRRWPFVVAGALLAVVAVYAVAAVWLGDRVPRGTTVSGVAVGGQGADEATATLDAAFGVAATPAGRADVDGREGPHHAEGPRPAGSTSPPPSTASSGSRCPRPRCGRTSPVASAQPAVVAVDDAAFAATVEKARAKLDAKPVEGSISLKGGKVAVRQPVTGTTHRRRGHRRRRAPLVARRPHRRGRGHRGRRRR